jgi:hypothetical protein
MKAVFNLTETTYVSAMWYLEFPPSLGTGGRAGNWQLMLYKDTPESPWRGTYRFRYYVDAAIFSSQDERSVYELSFREDVTESELVADLEGMARQLGQLMGATLQDCMTVNGGLHEFLAASGDKPWMHVKIPDVPVSQA